VYGCNGTLRVNSQGATCNALPPHTTSTDALQLLHHMGRQRGQQQRGESPLRVIGPWKYCSPRRKMAFIFLPIPRLDRSECLRVLVGPHSATMRDACLSNHTLCSGWHFTQETKVGTFGGFRLPRRRMVFDPRHNGQ
jgi:hypothetical protein